VNSFVHPVRAGVFNEPQNIRFYAHLSPGNEIAA
jgi:hypothetical protein